jgi:hypothetical protein
MLICVEVGGNGPGGAWHWRIDWIWKNNISATNHVFSVLSGRRRGHGGHVSVGPSLRGLGEGARVCGGCVVAVREIRRDAIAGVVAETAVFPLDLGGKKNPGPGADEGEGYTWPITALKPYNVQSSHSPIARPTLNIFSLTDHLNFLQLRVSFSSPRPAARPADQNGSTAAC